jgi:hypothetical protein
MAGIVGIARSACILCVDKIQRVLVVNEVVHTVTIML